MTNSVDTTAGTAAPLIAERTYRLVDDGPPIVTLRLYQPVPDPQFEYSCRWSISTEAQTVEASAFGTDTLDALDAALWMAGSRLEVLNSEVFSNQLRYLAALPDRPLGVPVIRKPGDFRPDYA